MNLTIRWHGTVKGQPRARATRAGGFVRMYTPDTADEMKIGIVSASMERMGHGRSWLAGYDGAVSVRIEAYFKRPKAHLRRGECKQGAPWKHAQKPDVDNIAKAVLDALTTAGVWLDDAQVWSLGVNRFWATDGYPPGLIVEVTA